MNASLVQDSDLDAPALEWLDRLLDAEPRERAEALAGLAAAQPALHLRLTRLLAAVEDPLASQRVHDPFAAASPAPAFAQGLAAGTSIGGYRLIRELGRGGMSVVWLAQRSDGVVKREVAVKLPLFTLSSGVDKVRFDRERDVLAALGHPGIASLLDAGVVAGGQPFIVLEFVDGVALDVACNDRRLGLRERLSMFTQVLRAVAHAHQHLVVHRDLKPSNILVDTAGRVRLLDFGVAKLLDEPGLARDQAHLTQVAGCGATPRYAAPEQVGNGTITTATDVYSLGVILFELLCGVSPYDDCASDPLRCLQAVTQAPAPRPSRVADAAFLGRSVAATEAARWHLALQGDLDNIVLKALSKSPSRRYASVERFLDDIQCFLDHRPVAARRPSRAHRLRLFVQRHVGASVATACGSLVAIAFGGVAIYQYNEGVAARTRTEIVRDFMFDLVNDAETDDRQPGAEPTGRQMVGAAIVRARERFATQPRLRGELLAELGRMQGRLGDDAASAALLAEAVELLRLNAPPGDAPLNKARAYLAAEDMGNGHPDTAAVLARTVLAECDAGTACAKARYYACTVMSRYELQQGRLAQALAWSVRGVRESGIGFGPQHTETALALLAQAVVARQAGQLELSRQSLDQALAQSETARLRLSDRISLSRTRAVLSLDFGDYADARDRLRNILPLARLAGDRAVLWRLLATVHLALGEAEDARDAAQAAAREAGGRGVEALLASQAHARALALLEPGAAAVAELDGVIDGLRRAGYADRAMEVLRARRYRAEAQIRAGERQAALASLVELVADQRQASKGQEVEFAQSLDALGIARLAAGQPGEALGAHAEAARLYALKLPPGHPLAIRNALYAHIAGRALDPAMPVADDLVRELQDYAGASSARSRWRAEAASALACLRSGTATCATLF